MGQYIDIIILLLVVVFILQRLKSVLGTRPEGESTKLSEESAAKIFDIIMKEACQLSAEHEISATNYSMILPTLTQPEAPESV